MKANYIIIFAILSLLIVGFLYWLIYLNRGNDSTTSLSLKVFGPILIAVFLLCWDLFNNPISKSNLFEVALFTDVKDCNPLNLGKAYYNVYNKGIGYSEITNTYRITDIKDSYINMVKSLNEDLETMIENQDSSSLHTFSEPNMFFAASNYNSKLIAITFINWLANVYDKSWTNENLKSKRFGGGQVFQNAVNKNEENTTCSVDVIIKPTNISVNRENSTQSKLITTPKTGKFLPIKHYIENGKTTSEISYSSKYIKSYKIKIIYNGYSYLTRGRIVEALKKKLTNYKQIYAFHYIVKIEYETYRYNKWAPETKAEIKWIENQMKMFQDNLSWEIIEDELVNSLESITEDINIEL